MSWQQSPGALDAVNRRIVADGMGAVKTLIADFANGFRFPVGCRLNHE
jgi:hypothetical protein